MSKITRGLAFAGACLAALAAAGPAASQTIDLGGAKMTLGSTRAPVTANVPIRVLSPGQNASAAAGRSDDSGTVDAPIHANAPIRILSPGNDGTGSSGEDAGGRPAPDDGPQVDAPVDVDAPVRILSPGDDAAPDGGGGGEAPAAAAAGSDTPAAGPPGGALGATAEGGADCAEVQPMSAIGGSGPPLASAIGLLCLALLGSALVGLRAAGISPGTVWHR